MIPLQLLGSDLKMLYIFTPTYNREKFLEKLYQSLLKQTNFSFKWLIVDDGSIDHTREMVKSWIKSSPFTIEYIYKENGGKHTAFNIALDKVQGYLNVCIDSDDTVLSNCVEIILKNHKHFEKKENIISYVYPWSCGIPKFKVDIEASPEIVNSWKISNDIPKIKEVIRVFKPSILDGVRFKIFNDEKFQPEAVLFSQAAKKGNSLYFPNPLIVGDYQEDGLSKQSGKLILNSPKGYVLSQCLQYEFLCDFPQKKNLENKTKIISHIVALNFGLKRNLLNDVPRTTLRILAIPIGLLYGLKKYKSVVK